MLTMFFRLLRDAEYFRAQISKLDGSDDLGPHLVSLVDRKIIAPIEIPKVASTNGNESNGVMQESDTTPPPEQPAADGNATPEAQTGTPTGSNDS